MEQLAGLVIVIIVALAAIISFIGVLAKNYLKAEPNEALIFTGRRHRATQKGWVAVVGGAKFRIPVLEIVNSISLKTMNLPNVRVQNAYSKEGVPVTIDLVANVKIGSEHELLEKAVERFLGTSPDEIQQIIRETLEGQLRDIIGVLTVEELYQKRDMFVNKVLEQAGQELAKIGVIIDIINIQDIRDEQGYLEALGKKRTAEVKRDAEIGEAEADRDAMKRAETAKREGLVVRADQQKQTAEADKQRDVAMRAYQGETLAATKTAEQQGPLAEARARQAVVTEQQKVQEVEQLARQKVEAAKADAETQKQKAEVVVPADAQKQAAVLSAEGEAAKILKVAEAQAKGIELKLLAEAKGITEKAKAWNQYGKAAQLNLALEAIKVVAGEGAKAIGQVKFDKVIALDSGSADGDSAVNRMLTAAPGGLVKFMEQIKAATGIDLGQLLSEIRAMKDTDTPAATDEAATDAGQPGKKKA